MPIWRVVKSSSMISYRAKRERTIHKRAIPSGGCTRFSKVSTSPDSRPHVRYIFCMTCNTRSFRICNYTSCRGSQISRVGSKTSATVRPGTNKEERAALAATLDQKVAHMGKQLVPSDAKPKKGPSKPKKDIVCTCTYTCAYGPRKPKPQNPGSYPQPF